MSEQIGRHKGAVETLMHEKKELSRLLQIVNSQLRRHLSALEDQGVDTDKFIEQLQQDQKNRQQQVEKQQRKDSRKTGTNNQRQGRGEQVSDEDANDILEDSSGSSRDFNPNR